MPLLLRTTPLVAVSAINAVGNINSAECQKSVYSTHYVTFGAGTGAGVVVVEAADSPNYAGIWAVLATITWAAADRVHTATVVGPHMALRHRVSTTVTGGTVSTSAIVAS